MENKTIENFNKKLIIKGLFAILITSILMLSIVPELPFATNTTTDTTNHVNEKSIVTAKAANVKVTWNANGGKIGTKNTKFTKIKKGTKIKKLPTTPKRIGYTFKGWYTKKTGGKKITINTKATKKVTHYAQWKRSLTSTEKTLVGEWSHVTSSGGSIYTFKSDGTFSVIGRIQIGSYAPTSYLWEGVWYVDKGTLYKFNLKAQKKQGDSGPWEPMELINANTKYDKYKIGTDERGKYLQLSPPDDIKLYK